MFANDYFGLLVEFVMHNLSKNVRKLSAIDPSSFFSYLILTMSWSSLPQHSFGQSFTLLADHKVFFDIWDVMKFTREKKLFLKKMKMYTYIQEILLQKDVDMCDYDDCKVNFDQQQGGFRD